MDKAHLPWAGSFPTASNLVAASESAIADIKLKSGRRIGNAVAKRVKACFCLFKGGVCSSS